jgi:hypothetical protein
MYYLCIDFEKTEKMKFRAEDIKHTILIIKNFTDVRSKRVHVAKEHEHDKGDKQFVVFSRYVI